MTTNYIVNQMITANKELYERILDTPVFAYWFNELVKKAIEADKK